MPAYIVHTEHKKYDGKTIRQVPTGYLMWIMRHIKDNEELVQKADEEYKKRKREKALKIEKRMTRQAKNKLAKLERIIKKTQSQIM